MAAFRLLGFLLSKNQRKQLKDLQRASAHHRDRGHVLSLLGERNWVFTGDLNLSAIEHVIAAGDAAVRLYREGLSLREVGPRLGVDRKLVRAALVVEGEEIRRRPT